MKKSDKRENKYNDGFYKDLDILTRNSAKIIVPMVIDILSPPHVGLKSVADFGCGVGTWLSVFQEYGIKDIKGFDGPWGKGRVLKIPEYCFETVDLTKEIQLLTKYDLAISLEVAEHLPEKSASLFIDTLTTASDFVLFSAAIPFQGGIEHINEQWLDYWNRLFNEKGYIGIDFLRMKIWNNPDVLPNYKQNMILFVKKEKLEHINVSKSAIYIDSPPPSLVYPTVYLEKTGIIFYRIASSKLFLFLKQILKKIFGENFFFLVKKRISKM